MGKLLEVAYGRILASDKHMHKLALRGITHAAITATAPIVYLNGYASAGGSAYPKTATADKNTLACAKAPLFIAAGAISAADRPVELLPMGMIVGINTSGGAVGDPVWLGDDGAPTLTKAGVQRQIGVIHTVDANDGEVWFDGSLVTNYITGTAEIDSGSSTDTISAATLGVNLGGKPVVAMLNEEDGTALRIRSAVWSNNDLVVTAEGNAGAARTYTYVIFL